MPAVTHDITIEQGATFSVVFAWTEADGTTPIPLTGYTAHMQIRSRKRKDADLLLDSDAGQITLTLDELAGTVTVRIGADMTDGLARGGAYDLELHSTGDPTEVVRLAEGAVTLSNEVTA